MSIGKVRIYRLLFVIVCVCVCVCVFVRLRISSPRIMLAASNFARRFIGDQGRKYPILENFASTEAQNWTNRSAREERWIIIIIIIITKSIFMVLSSWQAIARVHPVHLMNADSAPRWPPTPRPSQLTWTVSPPKERQLPSTSTIAILLLLSRSADTHFIVPLRVEGWVNLGTAVRVCSPCPRLYIAMAVVINTTACGEIRTWVLSHCSQACYR